LGLYLKFGPRIFYLPYFSHTFVHGSCFVGAYVVIGMWWVAAGYVLAWCGGGAVYLPTRLVGDRQGGWFLSWREKGGALFIGGGTFSWDGVMLVLLWADDKIPVIWKFFETLPLHFEFFPDMFILACAVAISSLPGRYACERVRHPNRLGLYGPHEFSAKRSPRGDGLLKTLPRIDVR
jgi:hypothetical protein